MKSHFLTPSVIHADISVPSESGQESLCLALAFGYHTHRISVFNTSPLWQKETKCTFYGISTQKQTLKWTSKNKMLTLCKQPWILEVLELYIPSMWPYVMHSKRSVHTLHPHILPRDRRSWVPLMKERAGKGDTASSSGSFYKSKHLTCNLERKPDSEPSLSLHIWPVYNEWLIGI